MERWYHGTKVHWGPWSKAPRAQMTQGPNGTSGILRDPGVSRGSPKRVVFFKWTFRGNVRILAQTGVPEGLKIRKYYLWCRFFTNSFITSVYPPPKYSPKASLVKIDYFSRKTHVLTVFRKFQEKWLEPISRDDFLRCFSLCPLQFPIPSKTLFYIQFRKIRNYKKSPKNI